jgi:lipoic acid synthetase
MGINRPDWLKASYNEDEIKKMDRLLSDLHLNTVCKEADCPNIGECFKKGTATFMIMGNNCTRNCRFCAVANGKGLPLDPMEPENIATASKHLNLKHIVVTSVTRDDLEDGGAEHFAQTIIALKKALPESTVEVLIPDMQGVEKDIDIIMAAKPDVINHNIETVPSLYTQVRPEADYHRSLGVLKYVKDNAPDIISKTGIMVGLGETEEQVEKVMEDLKVIGCEVLTIGQYLRPSKEHLEVKEYVSMEQFHAYKELGLKKGLKYVASNPLVRSSYNAQEAINEIRKSGGVL